MLTVCLQYFFYFVLLLKLQINGNIVIKKELIAEKKSNKLMYLKNSNLFYISGYLCKSEITILFYRNFFLILDTLQSLSCVIWFCLLISAKSCPYSLNGLKFSIVECYFFHQWPTNSWYSPKCLPSKLLLKL